MEYLWAVQTVLISEIEELLGVKVTEFTEGDLDTPKGGIRGIRFSFAAALSPGQEARLKNYLATATREKLEPAA